MRVVWDRERRGEGFPSRLTPDASRLFALFLLLALTCVAAAFHPANIASARAKVSVDGAVDIRFRFDILAYVLDQKPSEVGDDQMKALLDLPEANLASQLKEAETRFRRDFQLVGGSVESFTFPTATEVEEWVRKNGRDMLPMMLSATAKAHFATAGRTSAFRFPDVLDTVVLTTEFPYQEPISEPVDPGNSSRALPIPTAAQVAAAQRAMTGARGTGVTPAKTRETKSNGGAPPPKPKASPGGEGTSPPMANLKGLAGDQPTKHAVGTSHPATTSASKSAGTSRPAPPATSAKGDTRHPTPTGPPSLSSVSENPQPLATVPSVAVLPGYIRMGFTHILPQGLDHILFVLGLFLLSTRTKDLLKQVTAFTVAHSLTLGLSLYGVVRLPSSIVEPVIAASIAFVAIENIFTTQMRAWRIYVVFGFGLVHGLGFASALQDLGLARANFLTALVGFNAGVELGQLTVVLAAFVAVGWFRSNKQYRAYVAVPASCAIALIALFWTVQRALH